MKVLEPIKELFGIEDAFLKYKRAVFASVNGDEGEPDLDLLEQVSKLPYEYRQHCQVHARRAAAAEDLKSISALEQELRELQRKAAAVVPVGDRSPTEFATIRELRAAVLLCDSPTPSPEAVAVAEKKSEIARLRAHAIRTLTETCDPNIKHEIESKQNQIRQIQHGIEERAQYRNLESLIAEQRQECEALQRDGYVQAACMRRSTRPEAVRAEAKAVYDRLVALRPAVADAAKADDQAREKIAAITDEIAKLEARKLDPEAMDFS